MINPSKKSNLYILPNKNSYSTITKFMRFLSEEKTILYLDFSYFKNKEISDHYLTYRSVSFELAQSPEDFKEFIITNLRNIDLVIIDINGVHNVHLIKAIEPLIQNLNLSVLCLEKRVSRLLDSNVKFEEIYLVDQKITCMSDESEFNFESFRTQYIRNIKLDKLI